MAYIAEAILESVTKVCSLLLFCIGICEISILMKHHAISHMKLKMLLLYIVR